MEIITTIFSQPFMTDTYAKLAIAVLSSKWDIYYTFSMRTNFGSFEIFINSSNLITLF